MRSPGLTPSARRPSPRFSTSASAVSAAIDSQRPARLRMNCAGLWYLATVSRKMPISVPGKSRSCGPGEWMGLCPARLNTVPGAPQAQKREAGFSNSLSGVPLTNRER